ncbi:MAG: PAS domain S-box protein [Sphingomonas sp.]|nr:PAS domain S-box protein [Sphingomonas sp.]
MIGPLYASSESHFRSILATIPDAMVVIDEKGHILSFSAAAEKMFGYAEQEVLGENVAILMPSPDREQHDQYLENYLETGRRKIIGIGRVTTARHRNGNTFPIELAVGEAFIDDRRIFTGFIHDITQRQQAEMRLQDLQAELAHVGRISEVASLATSLAHELNQPLTAIANYSEAARDLFEGEIDGEKAQLIRQALDETVNEAIRAGQIVARLRQFISRGDTERQMESLSRLIGEANALALVGTREHGIDVQVLLDRSADVVFVDRVHIQQVLINLIRNAIDAMMDSSARSLVIRTEAGADNFVTISIEDTGSGISEKVAEQLFQPFVSTKQAGMGIGLSICRNIIEAHGGHIWFEPRPGGGTSFRFTVPTMEATNE